MFSGQVYDAAGENFTFKMMKFVMKMMNVVFQMMNVVLK